MVYKKLFANYCKFRLNDITKNWFEKKRPVYRTIGKVSTVRKLTGKLQYNRSHRCQSTRSRLRSLNENRAAVGPEKPIINRRVHKVSEMSVVSDEYLNQLTRANGIYNRTISTDTQRSKKEVQFDFSLKSFNEDNENAYIVWHQINYYNWLLPDWGEFEIES